RRPTLAYAAISPFGRESFRRKPASPERSEVGTGTFIRVRGRAAREPRMGFALPRFLDCSRVAGGVEGARLWHAPRFHRSAGSLLGASWRVPNAVRSSSCAARLDGEIVGTRPPAGRMTRGRHPPHPPRGGYRTRKRTTTSPPR